MKKTIILFALLMSTIIYSLVFAQNNSERQAYDYAETTIAYKEMLNGLRGVLYNDQCINIDKIISSEREPEKDNDTHYALFDTNGDGQPELHIRSQNHYFIISYKNEDLYVWKDLSPYYTQLDNGAFLHFRPGGTPPHMSYIYLIMNYSGDETLNIYFEKYDMDANGVYDENDKYLYEGIEVTLDEWTSLTEKYLTEKSDSIEWCVYSRGNNEL